MRSAESSVEKEEPEIKGDLRIEGIAQDVILEDEERMGQIQEVVDKLRTGYHTKASMKIWRNRKTHQVQRRVESHNSRIGQH